MLSYDELMKKYKKDEKETKVAGPSLPKTTAAKTAGPSAPKTAKTAEKSAVSSVSGGKNIPNTNLFKGLNVSKPETKKLSGSDSDVLQRAKALAANKTMSYTEKKKQIDQMQKELGKVRDKNLLGSFLGNQEAKKTISQVTDLQNQLSQQLKSTAFGAGFGQAAGLDLYDSVAKKTVANNKGAAAQYEKQEAARKAVQAAHPGSYTGGQVAGELTQQAILYGTIGAAAEAKAAPMIGKVLGGKELGKAGAFATKVLANQAADTAVMTPLTIAAGLADGKEGKEIATDVAKQQGMDLAFNIGIGAAGEGLKALKGARATAKEAKEARAAARSAERAAEAAKAAETQAERKLIETVDLPASLYDEYALKKSDAYQKQKMEELAAKYGRDSQKYEDELYKLLKELKDYEDMLGIRTNKVKDTERAIKTNAVKQAKNILNLSGKSVTDETRKMMEKALTEAAKTGKVSKATRDTMFDLLFDSGRISNRADIDSELKETLKAMRLTIGKQDAGDIADFNAWRKGTMGKLGGVKVAEKGDIDIRYMELSDRWPEYFPEDIVVPSEQLRRIAEVADEMKYREIPLAETMDEGTKAGMRESFEQTMDAMEKEAAKLARYTSERADTQMRKLAQKGVQLDYSKLTTADVKALEKQVYELEKEVSRVRRKRNLTEDDNAMIKKMVRGEMNPERAKEIAGVNGDDLMDVYAAELPYYHAKNTYQGYQNYARSHVRRKIDEITGEMPVKAMDGHGWKDANGILMGRETPERVIDMVAPKEVAAKIKSYIFDAFHDNERKRTIYINDFKDKLRDMHISTKQNIDLKMPNGETMKFSESGLVQLLGEQRFELQKLRSLKEQPTLEQVNQMNTLEQLIRTAEGAVSKNQLKRIDDAIGKMQKIYKEEIHGILNDELIRNGMDPVGYIEGYFPHMNFDDPTNLLGQFAQKLGWDFASKELPMDIAGITEGFRPNRRWSGNLLERKGTETDYDALRAFDLYIDNVSDIIYHTEDIRKLRALEDSVRYKLSDEGVRARVDEIRNNPELDEIQKAEQIQAEYDKVKNPTLQNFVTWLRTYTDIQAGKKHPADRQWEKVLGRKFYKISREIENRVASNMVVGNIGSAMTNFIPITQGMANMSLKSNLQGLKEAMEYMAKGSADELTEKSAFLTTREGTELLYETGLRKISNAAAMPMTLADKFSTQAVWRSRYYDNMAKGMTEDAAIKNADQYARNLFGGRSKGAMPTMFHAQNPLYKSITMFQLEVNNQLSYLLKDIPKEAHGNALKLFQAYSGVLVGAYVFNDVYEKLTGRRSALDPIGLANDYIGDLNGAKLRNIVDIATGAAKGEGLQLTEKTEVKKESAAFDDLLKEAGGNVPFLGGIVFDGGRIPIKSALPDLKGAKKTVTDWKNGEISGAKAREDLYEDLSPALWYGLMPTAGGQARKTLHGLNTMNQGGRYNEANDGKELQFAVDQEKGSEWLKAALFGNWATEGGKEYLESGNKKALSAKRTAVQLEAQEKYGISPKDYVAIFKDVNSKETRLSQVNALKKAGLSEDAEEFFYQNNILNSDSQKEEYAKLRSQGMSYNVARDFQTKEKTMDHKYETMIVPEGFGATKAEKKATEMYDYIEGLSISDSMKAQLQEEYAGSAIQFQKKYQKVKGILTTDDYATLNDYIGTLNGKRNGETVYLLKSRRVKAAIDKNVKGKTKAEMRKLYEAWDVSEKVW